MEKKMNKKILTTAIASVILTISCGIAPENGAPVEEQAKPGLRYHLSGEPALDAALPYMSADELASFGLLDDSSYRITTKSGTGVVSATTYGPLSDRRAVRGRKFCVNVNINGTLSDTNFTVKYGTNPNNLNQSFPMSQTGYGNRVAFIPVPNNSTLTKVYYKVVGNAGAVADNGGKPFTVAVYSSIFSYRMQGSQVILNYSGPAAGGETWLHAGWNNWNNVFDSQMTSVTYEVWKYAAPGGYANVYVDLPYWANYLDYVVTGNGIYDNNSGKDWHTSMRPLVDSRVEYVSGTNKTVSIYYANGNLNPAVAHTGLDGWKNLKDVSLTVSYDGSWYGTRSVPTNSAKLDLSFRDNSGNWNNNFGNNWSFDIR